MNTKRALKNLGKLGKIIFYQVLDNDITLISDGHIVFSIYTEEFEDFKIECFKKNELREYNLLKLFEDNKMVDIRTRKTPLSIIDNGRILCAFKSTVNNENIFTAIDKRFIDIIDDIYDLSPWEEYTYKMNNEKNSPIISAQWAYDKFYGGFIILPVNFDIKNIVTQIMELSD